MIDRDPFNTQIYYVKDFKDTEERGFLLLLLLFLGFLFVFVFVFFGGGRGRKERKGWNGQQEGLGLLGVFSTEEHISSYVLNYHKEVWYSLMLQWLIICMYY